MSNTESFFSTIQNYVNARLPSLPGENKQSLWGRYFAICLKEVLQENKKMLSELFGVNKNIDINLEYTYTKDRKADMALFDKDGQLYSLVEIKIEDTLRKGQLESYVKYCKKNKTKFLFITRWSADKKEIALIKTVGRIITLSEIYEAIERNLSIGKHPLSKMFCKFLKESEMIYERNISNDLSFLAQKIFFSSNQEQHVTIDKLRDGIPKSLSTIFTNLEIITRDLMEKLNINSRKLSLNMWFNPYCSGDKLNKLKEKKNFEEDENFNLKSELKMIESGAIWFCSLINIGDSNSTYCSLEFGLGLEIDSNIKQPDLSLYWKINPDSDDVTYDTKLISYFKKDKAWRLPTKEDVIEILEKGFRNAIKVYEVEYADTKLSAAKRIPYLCKVMKK